MRCTQSCVDLLFVVALQSGLVPQEFCLEFKTYHLETRVYKAGKCGAPQRQLGDLLQADTRAFHIPLCCSQYWMREENWLTPILLTSQY